MGQFTKDKSKMDNQMVGARCSIRTGSVTKASLRRESNTERANTTTSKDNSTSETGKITSRMESANTFIKMAHGIAENSKTT